MGDPSASTRGAHGYVLYSERPNDFDRILERALALRDGRVEAAPSNPALPPQLRRAPDVIAAPSPLAGVDATFGPPAFPFKVLEVDAPEGVHGPQRAQSWHVAGETGAASLFVRNGEHVTVVLQRLSDPVRFDTVVARRLLTEVAEVLKAERRPTLEQGQEQLQQALVHSARTHGLSGPCRLAGLAALSTVRGRLWEHVPGDGLVKGKRVYGPLLALAAGWAALHGDRPNPLDPVIELVRMDCFPGVTGQAVTGCFARDRQPLVVGAHASAVTRRPAASQQCL